MKWPFKPPLGALSANHPLANGLLAAYLNNEGGGARLHDLTGRNSAQTATSNWTNTPLGPSLSYDGTTNYAEATNFDLNAPHRGTLIAYFRTTVTQTSLLISVSNPTETNHGFGLYLVNTNAVGSDCNNDVVSTSATASKTYADGNIHQLAATWDGANHRLYFDGILVDSQANTTGFLTARILRFGAFASGSLMFTGEIPLAYIYQRALTPSEIWQLKVDPFAICFPRRPWPLVHASQLNTLLGLFDPELRREALFDATLIKEGWFDPELIGEGSLELVIQNSTHGHISTSPTLTQVHSLTVQNASHAHTAQNLALTQVHSLSIQNSAHGHTAQNLVLAQTYILGIQNGSHAHSAGSLTLTQVHELSIANAAHAHTANSLTLTQAHQIVIANASHAHSAQSLALTQVHNLTIQSSAHAHTAENVVLETEGQLGIHSATHAHTAQNVALTQVHSLVIASATHGHMAQNLTLESAVNLSIQSAVHSHSADNPTLTQAHSLTVSDSVHSHTAQNIFLGSQDDLTIQDSVHGHTASSINFAFPVAAINNVTVPADTGFIVPAEMTFTVPGEDRTFEV